MFIFSSVQMEDHVNQLIKTQMINTSPSLHQRTRRVQRRIPDAPTDVSRRRRTSMTSSDEKLTKDDEERFFASFALKFVECQSRTSLFFLDRKRSSSGLVFVVEINKRELRPFISYAIDLLTSLPSLACRSSLSINVRNGKHPVD